MQKANADVREAAKKAGIPLWAIAEELGVSEATLTRKMRFEMLNDDKRTIREVIDIIAGRAVMMYADANNQ